MDPLWWVMLLAGTFLAGFLLAGTGAMLMDASDFWSGFCVLIGCTFMFIFVCEIAYLIAQGMAKA